MRKRGRFKQCTRLATPAVLEGWTTRDIHSIGAWVSQTDPGVAAGLRLVYLHMTHYRPLLTTDRRPTKRTGRQRGLFGESRI